MYGAVYVSFSSLIVSLPFWHYARLCLVSAVINPMTHDPSEIIQKLFLISKLKTVVLFNIFVETLLYIFFPEYFVEKVQKNRNIIE